MAESAQLARFCRQVLQLETRPDFPPPGILREDAAQDCIVENAFLEETVQWLPPAGYRLRILKSLASRVEQSITDWDQHGISEKLASALATLLAVPVLPPSLSADRRDYVTYTLSSLGGSSSQASTVTLLENRALIAAAGTTGLRTWEASLHLGQYLCANAALVAGNRVLELGAGTGYLSILCAKLLGAANVIATDGSDDVVNALSDNFFINGFQNASHIRAVQLKWGHALVSNESVAWNENLALDIVLGADITYDESSMPLLLGTIQKLLEKHPNAEVLLAATERNAKTFAFFVAACRKVGLIVDAVDFLMPPRAKQKGPFYADNVPIHICRLVAEQAPNP